MERRSTGAMAAGIVLVSVGGILTLSGAVVSSNLFCGFSCGGSSKTGTVIGLLLGGVAALGAGIPLLVYGAKKVPVSGAPAVSWVGAPTADGWMWRF